MSLPSIPSSTRTLFAALAMLLALGGCATLAGRDPLQINVVGLEPIEGQGLEFRMALKLRVQNPNDNAISYDGVGLQLELNGRPFATGVSDQAGTVPRFGEVVLSVPVSVSAFSAMRQALGLAAGSTLENVPYALSGRLGGGPFGGTRFADKGRLSLPGFK
jgi:LEA14-like dessication related protein